MRGAVTIQRFISGALLALGCAVAAGSAAETLDRPSAADAASSSIDVPLDAAPSFEKGGFRHGELPAWPETSLDLAPIRAQVAAEAAQRCATKLAGAPLDLGPAEGFAAKVAKGAASQALSTALGFLGASGGGGDEKKPALYDDPVRHKTTFSDPATDTRLELGGIAARDGLLLSARIDKSDGKGTFHTIFLERPDCARLFPTRELGYALWGKWTLDVSITKTTSTYQNGVLTGQSVEHSGWSKSGTFDFSRGVRLIDTTPTGESTLVLDPDLAYLNQLKRELTEPLWRKMGYGEPVEGLRSVGALFENTTAAELGADTIAVVHVTRIDHGRYRTVGFPLKISPQPDGTLAFSQL